MASQKKTIGYASIGESGEEDISKLLSLKEFGCTAIFQEQFKAKNIERNRTRAEFLKAIKTLRRGDQIILERLNQLGSTQDLVVNQLNQIASKGVHIRTLDRVLDTKKMGKYYQIWMRFLTEILTLSEATKKDAELNFRPLKIQRSQNLGGRPKISKEKENLVLILRSQGYSYRSIRKQVGVALSTIRRIIIESE